MCTHVFLTVHLLKISKQGVSRFSTKVTINSIKNEQNNFHSCIRQLQKASHFHDFVFFLRNPLRLCISSLKMFTRGHRSGEMNICYSLLQPQLSPYIYVYSNQVKFHTKLEFNLYVGERTNKRNSFYRVHTDQTTAHSNVL